MIGKKIEKTGTEHEKGRKALVYKKIQITVIGMVKEKWVEHKDFQKGELMKYICEF